MAGQILARLYRCRQYRFSMTTRLAWTAASLARARAATLADSSAPYAEGSRYLSRDRAGHLVDVHNDRKTFRLQGKHIARSVQRHWPAVSQPLWSLIGFCSYFGCLLPIHAAIPSPLREFAPDNPISPPMKGPFHRADGMPSGRRDPRERSLDLRTQA